MMTLPNQDLSTGLFAEVIFEQLSLRPRNHPQWRDARRDRQGHGRQNHSIRGFIFRHAGEGRMDLPVKSFKSDAGERT